MRSDVIHLAIPAVGETYRFYAEVTAASARLGSSLPIEVHYIDENDFRRVMETTGSRQVFTAYHGSTITWSRLFLPEMFPDLDWVVSCDADILFRGDIADLWNLRDTAYWAQPSRDCPFPGLPYNEASVRWLAEKGLVLEAPEEYFCAGLTIFNLKEMRESGWGGMRDDFLERYGISGLHDADQCVLNYLLRNRKKLLPRGWGVFSGDENADIDWSKSCAVHYVEDAPWKRWKVTHLVSDLMEIWWDMARTVRKQYPKEKGYGYLGCRNRFDWLWRRAAFVFLKHNQWLLRLNHRVWLHFRSTRGVAMRTTCESKCP